MSTGLALHFGCFTYLGKCSAEPVHSQDLVFMPGSNGFFLPQLYFISYPRHNNLLYISKDVVPAVWVHWGRIRQLGSHVTWLYIRSHPSLSHITQVLANVIHHLFPWKRQTSALSLIAGKLTSSASTSCNPSALDRAWNTAPRIATGTNLPPTPYLSHLIMQRHNF